MEIQYISTTHTNKDEAKHDKKMCNSLHNIFIKDCSFDEVCDLHDSGCSIGRVGRTTDFVMIDIDESSINIQTIYSIYKDDEDVHVSYSASMNPLKYHILVNLHRTITLDEYKDAVQSEFENIKSRVCDRANWMNLDKNADNFYQCFFGQSVENRYDNILHGSKRLYCWTKKDAEPRLYVEKDHNIHPSLNSADYCKKNGLLTVREDQRFDIYLPSMTNGRLKKIAIGHRYNWCRMIGTKLIMRILYLNHYFGEEWTNSDFHNTAEWIFRSNVIMTDEFESDIEELIEWLDKQWNTLSNIPFEDMKKILEPYFSCSKRQYRSRGFTLSQMSTLLHNRLYDENTVLFTDKSDLKSACEEMMISDRTFREYVESLHMTIAFECETKRRCKHDVEGMTIDQFNAYCRENGLSKQMKSKLKRQYGIR